MLAAKNGQAVGLPEGKKNSRTGVPGAIRAVVRAIQAGPALQVRLLLLHLVGLLPGLLVVQVLRAVHLERLHPLPLHQ